MKLRFRKRYLSSGRISLISVVLLISSFLLTVMSGKYMASCLKRENEAQKNRYELHRLGEKFADSSDYLTDEARKFAVTGNLENMKNYWDEVIINRNRDSVIEKIAEYGLTENETELLSEAKAYSDRLIETETYSMKLIFVSGYTVPSEYDDEDEYIKIVMDYDVPETFYDMNSAEVKNYACELLYSNEYSHSKEMILTPINRFQTEMDNRMNAELQRAVEGKNIAVILQIICSVLVVVIIAVMVIGFNTLYIKPLKNYSEELLASDIEGRFKNNDYSMIYIKPQGAYELFSFANIYNQLFTVLKRELMCRIEAENKMRNARDEADRANQTKTDFFAQMSHELRTPLNTVTGYIYLLRQTKLDNTQQDYCNSIEYSARSLLSVINNILDFSKIESGKMVFETTEFNLRQLLSDIIRMMKISAVQKSVELKINAGGIPDFAAGDYVKLKQVLINLIGNAVKFTDEGEVSVSVSLCHEDDRRFTLKFSVRDTGHGIKNSDIENIFNPFVQSSDGTTRKYDGTGLGLPISQMIVSSASGGRYNIEVESEPGKGSVFSFLMDFYKAEKSNISDTEDILHETLLKNADILLVDDNIINLEMEKSLFRNFGVNVTTASCGLAAVRLAEKHVYQVVFLDLHMPDMDGYETARLIRQKEGYHDIPIVALTADVISGTEEKIRKSGMNGYITKPIQVSQIYSVIKSGIDLNEYNQNHDDGGHDKIFDFETCLISLGGNKNKLDEFVRMFLRRHRRDGEYICQHIHSGYFGNAESMLHDLKGVSGNLGCRMLCNEIQKMRDSISENTVPDTDKFMEIWNNTLAVLEEYISEEKKEAEHNEKLLADDTENILSVFSELCSDYNISAYDYFYENISVFSSIMDKLHFNEMKMCIDSFDFPGAAELLGEVNVYV